MRKWGSVSAQTNVYSIWKWFAGVFNTGIHFLSETLRSLQDVGIHSHLCNQCWTELVYYWRHNFLVRWTITHRRIKEFPAYLTGLTLNKRVLTLLVYLCYGRPREKTTMQNITNDSLRNYLFSRDDPWNLRVSEPVVDVKTKVSCGVIIYSLCCHSLLWWWNVF